MKTLPTHIDRIEALHPGMKVIAGPFKVGSACPSIAAKEKALAQSALFTQLLKDATAKRVTVGRDEWVLRSAAGWQYLATKKGRFNSQLGIRAGRGGSL